MKNCFIPHMVCVSSCRNENGEGCFCISLLQTQPWRVSPGLFALEVGFLITKVETKGRVGSPDCWFSSLTECYFLQEALAKLIVVFNPHLKCTYNTKGSTNSFFPHLPNLITATSQCLRIAIYVVNCMEKVRGSALDLWPSCLSWAELLLSGARVLSSSKKKKGNNVGVLFFFVVVLFSRRLPPHLGKCLQRKEKMADGKR